MELQSLVKFLYLIKPAGVYLRRRSLTVIHKKLSKGSVYDNLILLEVSFVVRRLHILSFKAFFLRHGKKPKVSVVRSEYLSTVLFKLDGY